MSLHRRIALALAPALLAGALLAGCTPASPGPGITPSGTLTPTDPTPDATIPESPTGDAGAELRANVVDAVRSGNTAAIEGYLAPVVHVTRCASEDEGDVSDPALVIDAVESVSSPTATWDFDLPADTLDTYANDPGHYPAYADDFPAGAIVGRSSDRAVLSFVAAGEAITRVFVCIDEFALTFEE